MATKSSADTGSEHPQTNQAGDAPNSDGVDNGTSDDPDDDNNAGNTAPQAAPEDDERLGHALRRARYFGYLIVQTLGGESRNRYLLVTDGAMSIEALEEVLAAMQASDEPLASGAGAADPVEASRTATALHDVLSTLRGIAGIAALISREAPVRSGSANRRDATLHRDTTLRVDAALHSEAAIRLHAASSAAATIEREASRLYGLLDELMTSGDIRGPAARRVPS